MSELTAKDYAITIADSGGNILGFDNVREHCDNPDKWPSIYLSRLEYAADGLRCMQGSS